MKQSVFAQIYKVIFVTELQFITICCRNEANLIFFVTPSSDHQESHLCRLSPPELNLRVILHYIYLNDIDVSYSVKKTNHFRNRSQLCLIVHIYTYIIDTITIDKPIKKSFRCDV